MKKKLLILFLFSCIYCNANALDLYESSLQNMPQYEFKSTSIIMPKQNINSMYTIQLYEIGSTNVSPYSTQPRKIIGIDGPKPGYDPADPMLPIGDSIQPLFIFVLIWTFFKFISNIKKHRFC